MSRVGKNEITFPAGLTMSEAGSILSFKGKMGETSYPLPGCIKLERTDKGVKLEPKDKTMTTRSLWGTSQRNIANIVKGLSEGFTKNIELVGVGYRASVAGKQLVLQLGFSHDINFDIPEGVTVRCDKPTAIAITSASKQQVGQIAAYLSTLRPPEPYKGKGVIRENVFVMRKEGKKK